MRVIGLMSGTSYDAIDAAAAELTLVGDSLGLRPLGLVSEPYDAELREALAAALPPAATSLAEVCRLDTRIGQAFAAAAVRAVDELCGGKAELIASHGQTVYHWVDAGRAQGTLQLGPPAWIAEATGLPVVADFRPRDIAAGGQGAPLVSLVDLLWLRGRPGTPVALNLTAPDGTAFDTGPGCALIDAAAKGFSDGRPAYDADGASTARVTVHGPLLRRLLLDEPYYALPAPPHHRQGAVPPRPSPGRAGRSRHPVRRGRDRHTHVADGPHGGGRRARGGRDGGDRLGRRHPQPRSDEDARVPAARPRTAHLRRPGPAVGGQGGVRLRGPRLPDHTRPGGTHPASTGTRHPAPEHPRLDHPGPGGPTAAASGKAPAQSVTEGAWPLVSRYLRIRNRLSP